MKRISFYIVIVLLGVSFFTSCEEQGLLTHTNDVSYIAFEKNMTTDTTGVSFKFYNEGENAKILLGVTISGKVQDKDLEFTVSVDPERTTLPATQYELPEKCVIKAGELTGEILVVLKYYEKEDKNSYGIVTNNPGYYYSYTFVADHALTVQFLIIIYYTGLPCIYCVRFPGSATFAMKVQCNMLSVNFISINSTVLTCVKWASPSRNKILFPLSVRAEIYL